MSKSSRRRMYYSLMAPVLLSVDADTGALYIRVRFGEVRETIEDAAKILVDIGERGDIIGIEILTTNEKILKAVDKTLWKDA